MKPANLGCQKVFSKFKENTGFWKIKLESLQVWAWASLLTQDPVFTFLKYKKLGLRENQALFVQNLFKLGNEVAQKNG